MLAARSSDLDSRVMGGSEDLRVLVADGRPERLEQVSLAVASLGHEVITLEDGLDAIGPTTAAERPDLAVVIVGESSDDALRTIGRIVHEAACPVIAVLDVEDPAFINEAARRPNAPSRLWYSANRCSVMSIELWSSAGSPPPRM